MAVLSLIVDRASRQSLSRQIYLQLRDLILSGRIAAGARLPATRALASDLRVSRIVPLAAYDQLTAEGYLTARRGSGVYAARLGGRPRAPGPTPHLAVQTAGMETAAPKAQAPFSLDGQDSAAFPHQTWARLLAKGWRRHTASGLVHDDPAGLLELRVAVARYVHILRGVACGPDQVLITSGNRESLQLIAALPPPGRREVWVEDPGYQAAQHALAMAGARLIPVPVDAHGLDVEAGRKAAPAAGLAMVTPARQFPTGAPMSLPRRLALLDWAREADALVIEDDYESEMRFAGRPLASLISLEPARVLALDSFSKLTFPGLRLGSIVGAAPLIERLAALRERQSNQTASIAQPALAEFLETGGMARHLRGLRRQLARRRQALIAALAEHLPGALAVQPQEVGRHLLATLTPCLTDAMNDVTLAGHAAIAGLRLTPLSPFYMRAPPMQGLLFGYAGWDEVAIEAGVAKLATVIKEMEG